MAKVDIYNTDKVYPIIYADPPWKQSKGGKKSVRANSSGKPLDYQTCTLDEIKEHLRQAVSLTNENCDWCREQGTEFQQFINLRNDAVSGQEEYRWCQFYNERLYPEKTDCCYTRNKKCMVRMGERLQRTTNCSKKY